MNGSEDNLDRGSKFETTKYIGFTMTVKYTKF